MKKTNRLKQIISVLGSFSVLSLTANGNVTAQTPSNNLFFCKTNSEGIPTTYITGPTGKFIELISWQKDAIGGFSPEERCQIVSERLQEAHEEGNLAYITHGFMNGSPVICGTSSNGGSCDKLLLTIRPEDDPKTTIENLFQAGSFSSSPLIQNNGKSRYYYSLSEFSPQ